MYINKRIPLFLATLLISLETSIITIGYVVIMGLSLALLPNFLPFEVTTTMIIIPMVLIVISALVLLTWLEGRHLHALNLIAESDIKIFAAFRLSKEAITQRFASAFLAFSYITILYLPITVINNAFKFQVYWIFSLLVSLLALCLGMLLFLIVVGATAVAYHHDIGSLEESTAVSQGNPT